MSPKLKFQQKVSIVEKLASPTTSVVKMSKIQSFSIDAKQFGQRRPYIISMTCSRPRK
jgi:hypothetical protein